VEPREHPELFIFFFEICILNISLSGCSPARTPSVTSFWQFHLSPPDFTDYEGGSQFRRYKMVAAFVSPTLLAL
jgi:hypothetical protein